MCSVEDDIEDNEKSTKFLPEKVIFKLSENNCLKCKSATPVVVLQHKYPYCKECFIASTIHKFKAVLGKNRVIHVDDKVLIWHRTGHPSTSLLHFLRTGMDLTTPKRIKFIPIILFIEDHYSLSIEERKTILSKIDEEVKNLFQFPTYYVSLTDYILKEIDLNLIIHEDYDKINITQNDLELVKKVFKKKSTKTVEKEILKIFQYQILTDVAKHLNCSSVFIPDLGIDIASQFLTSISLGRGAHTIYDIGAVDTRDKEIKILRPLRTFTIKELALYNHFHKLEPVTYTLLEENFHSSVQNLLNKFVSDLQVNYPATISTVIRTGDKLSTDKGVESKEKCLLCKVPIENKPHFLQSTEATNFSHWVSTRLSEDTLSIEEKAEQLIDGFNNTSEKKYCFSCSRMSDFLL